MRKSDADEDGALRRPRGAGSCTRRSLVRTGFAMLFSVALGPWTQATLAHAPELVVEPAVAEPGSTVSVHGDYLWTDEPVTIDFFSGRGAKSLIVKGATDGTGHLELTVSLPDLRDDTYAVVVTNTIGERAETTLVVETPLSPAPLVGAGLIAGAAFLLVRVLLKRRPLSPAR